MSFGTEIRDLAYREARRLLGEAVAHRREHPYYWHRVWHYEAVRWGPHKGQRHTVWQRFRWFIARRRRDHFRSRALATGDVRECDCSEAE